MAERRELMLILAPNRSADDLSGSWRVTQRISPRVVIVETEDERAKERIEAIDGVEAVLEAGETPPQHVRDTLTANEQLFADAYAQRARRKERPGDGLDWDAAGFLPPDPPKQR